MSKIIGYRERSHRENGITFYFDGDRAPFVKKTDFAIALGVKGNLLNKVVHELYPDCELVPLACIPKAVYEWKPFGSDRKLAREKILFDLMEVGIKDYCDRVSGAHLEPQFLYFF